MYNHDTPALRALRELQEEENRTKARLRLERADYDDRESERRMWEEERDHRLWYANASPEERAAFDKKESDSQFFKGLILVVIIVVLYAGHKGDTSNSPVFPKPVTTKEELVQHLQNQNSQGVRQKGREGIVPSSSKGKSHDAHPMKPATAREELIEQIRRNKQR